MGNTTGITVTDSVNVPHCSMLPNFFDFNVLATVAVACERSRLYHPLKLVIAIILKA